MQQEKWHQQEIMVLGIQIPPTSRTCPTLGSIVGVTTVMVRTRGLSTSAAAVVVRAVSARSVFRLAVWTDEVRLWTDPFHLTVSDVVN